MSNKTKRYQIKYERERALLSDVLPFEVPLFFSNRKFYDFLKKYNKSDLVYKELVPDFLKIHLFGLQQTVSGWSESPRLDTIPFKFEIRHKEDQPRTLAIIHPKNQIKVTDFYHRYKSLIVYYGNKGKFSLRKIHSVTKEEYFDDDLHRKLYSDKDKVEVMSKEYRSLSSFFTYENYSIMYKFFESNDFHKEEKRFSKMIRLDISRCFDRIYTHSLPWAILNKVFVKDNLSSLRNGFGDAFDSLMQRMNYNETNGIVIGPEFSRIFAEIILQRVDVDIEQALKSGYELSNKVDYSIHRYIDDYFIFYNQDTDLAHIKKVVINKLQQYNLFINEAKSKVFEKPLITDETIAKNEIKKLFTELVIIRSVEDQEFEFKLNANELKTAIKSIIQKRGLGYGNVLNYIFHLISKKVRRVCKIYAQNINSKDLTCRVDFINGVSKFLWNALDLMFFLYSAEPKVVQTIALSSIISDIFNITKDKELKDGFLSEYIHKKIYDEICAVIKINANHRWSKIETIYLITVIKELGDEYVLGDDFLNKYFLTPDGGVMNYFEIMSILFYVYKKNDQQKILGQVLEAITEKLISLKGETVKNAEAFLIVLDVLSNKEIGVQFKTALMKSFDPGLSRKKITEIIDFVEKENLGFVDWENFNFRNSVKQKKRLRVY